MQTNYIIIGAGSAGCVLANRLSEDPGISVVLLEAGAEDKSWLFSMPLAWTQLFNKPQYDWGYFSEPEPFLNNREIPSARGKVLGGCSSVNGMMYSRGHREDYDQWSELGINGWSYDDVLPYFKRSENNWRKESEEHGRTGLLHVSRLHNLDQVVSKQLLESAQAMGYKKLDDFVVGNGEGFSIPDFTVAAGVRSSSSSGYLRPAMTRPNLQVITGAMTTKIIIENGRACGVEYVVNKEKKKIRCDQEVLLSAGAFNSPQLLMLSGIGSPDELSHLGINPVLDLPGVGNNLQDHTTIAGSYDLSEDVGFESELRLDRLVKSVLQWFLFKSGPAASMPFGAQGFFKLSEDSHKTDIQFLATPTGMLAVPWFPGLRKGAGHQISTVGIQLHPKSRGWVKLRSKNPYDAPRILYNMLSEPEDLQQMRDLVRWTRNYLNTSPVNKLLKRETLPGPEVQSDKQIDEYLRNNIATSFHPVGTCAMGGGDDSVVDSQLRVRGIDGLRVVDASIIPLIIGGNTNAPAMMIAEKAADMILE